MALWARLLGPDRDLPIHQFVDGMMMVEMGLETKADFKTTFGILPEDEAQLDALMALWKDVSVARRYHDLSFRTVLEGMLRLAEGEYFGYDDKTIFQTKLSEAITVLNAL